MSDVEGVHIQTQSYCFHLPLAHWLVGACMFALMTERIHLSTLGLSYVSNICLPLTVHACGSICSALKVQRETFYVWACMHISVHVYGEGQFYSSAGDVSLGKEISYPC